MKPGALAHADANELLALHALGSLAAEDGAALEAHAAVCESCRADLAALRATVGAFAAWPTDVLRPVPALWDRLAHRIGGAMGRGPLARSPAAADEPAWEQVAPGIECKLLASDRESERVSMLVRLAPGAEYPPHRHAGIEELFLLDGELWIDDRLLHAGAYSRAEAGTSDRRVWSPTGCTCVLITSTRDELS
jgi:anti-sigma factor ChrR (cupin superfamily)